MKVKICGIYKIVNIINNKIYIGQSKDIDNRFLQHKRKLNNNCHCNSHLQSSWNIYGEENFVFEIVHVIDNNNKDIAEKLNELESEYIKIFNSCNDNYGFNMNFGGDNPLKTEEWKEKIKEKWKERSRKIYQIDFEGNIVHLWDNARKASKHTQIKQSAIQSAVRRNNISQGFIWIFEDEIDITKFNLEHYSDKIMDYCSSTAVVQMDLNYNYIRQFNSIAEASKYVGVSRTGIERVCSGKCKTCAGHTWILLSDYNNGTLCKYESKLKKVYQYNRYGELIKIWCSVNEINSVLGYDKSKIHTACNVNDNYHPYGFVWSFYNTFPTHIPIIKEVYQIDKENNIIKLWDSIKHASMELKIDRSTIYRCCIGKQKTSGGFKWRYKEDCSIDEII